MGVSGGPSSTRDRSQLKDKHGGSVGRVCHRGIFQCWKESVLAPALATRPHLPPQVIANVSRADLHVWCTGLGVLGSGKESPHSWEALWAVEGEWRLRGGPEMGQEVGTENQQGWKGTLSWQLQLHPAFQPCFAHLW